MTRRAHGIPAVRGPLRTYRVCDCAGEGCYRCHGAGRVFVSRTPHREAHEHARTVIGDYQAKGRLGRNM